MWENKRGSTLVMVLCVFAFVLIVGVGVMTLAGVASKQMSNTLGQQRADAAAYSVLDTVSTQIMDRTIAPFELGKGATYKTEGGGIDDTLGKYNILIEKAEKADEKNLFKVGVTLERNGYVSSVYNLLKYTTGGSGMPDLKKTFDVTIGATSANRKATSLPTDVGMSKIVGSIFVDNGNNLSMMFGNTGVTQNVDMIGHVNLEDGAFGTKDAENHINATESLFVSTPQPVYGEIHAGTDAIIEKSFNVTENIYANGSVLVGANARINGDIHAGGDVEVSNGARVSGVIYANGDVKVNKARVNNDIFAQGNVWISDNSTTQNIYTNGEVSMQNSMINGDISAVGKVDVNGTVAGKITTNGNCTVKDTVGKDIHACGDVLLQNIKRIKDVFAGGTLSADGINGSVNCSAVKDMTLKNCNLYFATFKTNGILHSTNTILEECTIAAAGGMIDEGGQLTAVISSNGDINLSGTRILGTLSTTENIVMENGSTVEDSPYAGTDVGDIRCGKNLIIKTDSNFSKVVFVDGDFSFDQKSAITSGVLVQGNASLTNNASLVGTLTVKGNALLTGIPGTQSVTGVIMLGGKIDPASTPGLNNRIVNVDPSLIPPMPPITRVDQDLSVPPIPDFALPNTLPVVELNLEQKYEKVPMLAIPDAIKQQMDQRLVNFSFEDTKSPDYKVEGDDYIISKNCVLTLDFTKGSVYGKRIVFDATSGDLYIKLKPPKGKLITVPNGVQLLSRGDYNVYLFLDEGTGKNDAIDFALSSNNFVGYYDYLDAGVPENDTRTPNMYLISNAKDVTINMSGISSAYAFLYAPYGTVNMKGATLAPYTAKLYGSAIASRFDMGNDNMYVQYVPKETGGSEISGWTVYETYYQPSEDK